MPKLLAHFFLIVVFGVTFPSSAQLDSTSAVRSLPPDQSDRELPVDLQAHIAHVTYPNTIFIQDHQSGTFFRSSKPNSDFRRGDLVRVRGTTFKGLYLTGINATQVDILSHGLPPPPLDATFDDLASGRFHYQLVRVRGVIRSTSDSDEGRTRLTLALGTNLLDVRFDSALSPSTPWVDTLVEISGLASGSINDRRQLVQPHLLAVDQSDIHVLSHSVKAEQAPEITASNLLRFQPSQDASPQLRRVRLKGQLLASQSDGQLYLRDVNQSPPTAFAANLVAPSEDFLKPGDILELVGFPEMSGFSARLNHSQILSRMRGPAPVPHPARITDLITTAPKTDNLTPTYLDSDLVTLTAQVVIQTQSPQSTTWQLLDGGRSLQADLKGTFPVFHPPGTIIAVTGICQIEGTANQGFRAIPSSVRLLIPDAAFVRVIKAPTWWTPRRLISLAGILAVVVFATLFWIFLLRKRVANQTEFIRSRIAKSAALEERQRIAREFHDTLEQELAGLSIRLGALGSLPLEPKADTLLSNSIHLVSRIQTEARNLVSDLRSEEVDSPTDLTFALKELASRQADNIGPGILWHHAPNLPPFPGPVVHHLRMITQEALTNALKHAQASQIDITTSILDRQLHLIIADNGKGISETPGSTPSNHFGQTGIRERARKIRASVEWHSTPGQGTTLEITLPLL